MIRLQSIGIVALTMIASLALPSCGTPNPKKVWLALNGSERAVQLVPYQPDPF